MTDRFKFRIWHDTQGMIYPDGTFIRVSQDKVMKLDPCIEEPRYFIMPLQDYDIMQCTGLKDVEGKLIYEGDLVRLLNESNHTKKEYWNPEYIVEHDGWSFSLKHVGGGKSIDCASFNLRHFNQGKIIGNIYETVQE